MGDIPGKLPNPPPTPGGGSKSLSSLLIYSKAVNRKGLATGREARPVNGSSGTNQNEDRTLKRRRDSVFHYKSFKMISQTINSKSKLADYKKYHKQSKTYIQELESKLENKVLTIEDYKFDLKRRLATHDKEFALALRDAALLLTSAKKQVVELFPIN